MGKSQFKINGSGIFLLCSNCSTIVKTGKDFTAQEWAALQSEGHVDSVYCEECQKNVIDIDEISTNKEKMQQDALNVVIPQMENKDFKDAILNHFADNLLKNINIEKNGI